MRSDIRDENVQSKLDHFAELAQHRKERIAGMEQRFDDWNQIRIGDAEEDYQAVLQELRNRRAAEAFQFAGDEMAAGFSSQAEGLPKTVGASNDPNAALRASLEFQAKLASLQGRGARYVMDYNTDQMAARRDRDNELDAAEMKQMQEQAQLNGAIRDSEIADLEEAFRVSNEISDNELAMLEDTIELMRAQREAELAYARDMAEFREKRTEYLKSLTEVSGRELRVARSEFNAVQRLLEYDAIVQKAQLEASRLQELDRKIGTFDALVGGIGAIFTESYTLERAEDQLDEARRALMDWLVVLEYYAVRPFIDQRLQIMLARNAYQLELVANDLQQLENTCGGSERSKETATLSLRRDVLGVSRPQQSSIDETISLPSEERFRQWLSQAYVPVNRRIRFSTSQTLSNVLDNTDDVLAATFALGLKDFANLDLACNAKIESIAINVVGDLGEHNPTVSLLYDGTSQLRSCQPNIDEYVRAFANGMTSYGTITQLRTEGRAMSPLAGLNGFSNTDSSVNRTLTGLPVASEYTLLISTERGDNARLDWSQLEDIEIRVEYSYQDLFQSSCD